MRQPTLWIFAVPVACAAMLFVVAPAGAQDRPSEDREEDRSVRRLGDVVSAGEAEFSMDIPNVAAPPRAQRPDVTLPDPDRNARLQALLDRRAAGGGDSEIDQALADLVAEVRLAGLDALEAGDLAAARARDAALRILSPDSSIGREIGVAVANREQIAGLIVRLDDALAEGRLLAPPEEAAVAILQRLRDLDSAAGRNASRRVRNALRERFEALLADQRFSDATEWIDATADIGLTDIEGWREMLRSAAGARIGALRNEVRESLEQGDADGAAAGLDRLGALGAAEAVVEPLAMRLLQLRRYGGFEPGQTFRDSVSDGGQGPEMVVVPTGSARLGAPAGERGRFEDEGPTFEVRIEQGFALSRTEITVAEFREFVRATGYRTDAERAGRSNAFDARSGGIVERRFVQWETDFQGDPAGDDLPVVHVSFNDARAYVQWLADATGAAYRLPSEAEFEYALRAGSDTRFWWGDASPGDPLENLAGQDDRYGRDQRWSDAFSDYGDGYWGPAPVASFPANPFGVHDLGGNVLEWVADCWIPGYEDPPTNGTARLTEDCDRRVLRGAAWTGGPRISRSAHRLSGPAEFADARVGIRVARDLIADP